MLVNTVKHKQILLGQATNKKIVTGQKDKLIILLMQEKFDLHRTAATVPVDFANST